MVERPRKYWWEFILTVCLVNEVQSLLIISRYCVFWTVYWTSDTVCAFSSEQSTHTSNSLKYAYQTLLYSLCSLCVIHTHRGDIVCIPPRYTVSALTNHTPYFIYVLQFFKNFQKFSQFFFKTIFSPSRYRTWTVYSSKKKFVFFRVLFHKMFNKRFDSWRTR